MIEVIVFFSDGRVAARAEAESPEDALFAARTLFDESLTGIRGQKRRVGFYVKGQLSRMVEGRP